MLFRAAGRKSPMNEISNKVVQISATYLGPAAKNFLERQTRSHMRNLDFNELKEDHLPELIKWVHISAGLIINDKADILARRLEKLFNVKRMN
jgi:hypothetical protein